MKTEQIATRTSRKIWRTLETTSVLALGSLAGCSSEAIEGNASQTQPAGPVAMTAVNEGEGAMDAALTAADDTAYLTQIGLMRGHLWVGHQLYLNDFSGMAATHMKHPKAELYSTLEEPFRVRGVAGFSAQLEQLADAVTQQLPEAEVNAAYSKLTAAITVSENGADTGSARIVGEAIVALLRVAGEEYAIGVVDGKINNLHEYQDALGFTKIAAQWARSPAFAKPAAATAAAARIQSIISELDVMWPELTPKQAIPHKAAQLYGAAANIEIEILGL